jgi:flavin-dependent dehydrogenase
VDAGLAALSGDKTSCLSIDWGTIWHGYGWMFPKRDTVNVGVGGPAAWGKQLRPYLARFFPRVTLGDLVFRGHQLPTARKGTRFSRGRVVLVGDAAGLVEPFTGDGITHALHSGQIAASVVGAALERDALDDAEYARQLGLEILEEIEYGGKLQRLFAAFPHLAHRYLVENDRAWRAFRGVIRGQYTFRDVRRKSTRSHEWLWAPLDAYAALRRSSPGASRIA